MPSMQKLTPFPRGMVILAAMVSAAMTTLARTDYSTAYGYTVTNPSGSQTSVAQAISGQQEAGYARIGASYHAGIWSGTASSFLDLNPAVSTLLSLGAAVVLLRLREPLRATPNL
jgi:hypothetical protein